ncbi:hypothetical protein ACHAXT_006322 [Thalassiosira profunda]
MTRAHSALAIASVALSPTCGAALSLYPRRQQTPIKAPSGTGLFGKRTGRATPRWVPSFQAYKSTISQLQSTKEKAEADLFFLEDEISADIHVNGHAKTPAPPSHPPKPPAPVGPTFLEKLGESETFKQIFNPTIAKNVPQTTIQGAAVNGAFLTLLTSFLLFGPLSLPSLSTLVAAATAGIITAYLSIIEGGAGDFLRGVGKTTSEFTEMIVTEVEQMKVADALTEKPKAKTAAGKKKAAPKKAPTIKDVADAMNMPLTEGLTAEEAEEVRTARVNGGGAPAPSKSAPTEVTEGQTAEEAMAARKAKEEEAARLAEEKKVAAAAAAEKKRKQEEEAAAKAKAKEEAKAKAAAEEEARAKAAAEEEARMRAEEEARAKAAAEEEARMAKLVEEEARAKAAAEEEARLAKLAEEEEQRRLEAQAEAAREAVRLMEEQEALMDDEDDEDEDELDDDDWEASVRLANELQGMPNIGGDVMDDIGDDFLRNEIDNLSQEEEDALGKAAREAVRKYEEEMATKSSQKQAVRSSWDDEMAATPSPPPAAKVGEDAINGLDEAAADVDYSKMTVAQLKDELRSKGLKVGGKKAELIERLESSA